MRKGKLVLHTHWDREWRYPLWENRMYLCNMMDELLEILDTQPDYTSFVLDGQTVIVEDYLQVRPYNREKVEKYIREGRIEVGPWYTLPDLYPVSGESLVRNLLRGTRLAEKMGKCTKVAYESFGWGQTAQFPQIYKQFGLDFSVVAKNVSKERAPQCEFFWEAPDGSRILATRLGEHARANFFMNAYLKITTGLDYNSDEYEFEWGRHGFVYHRADKNGYWNDFHKMNHDECIHEDAIRDAVDVAIHAMDGSSDKELIPLFDGSDSTTAQPLITDLVKKMNEMYDDVEFEHVTLSEYAREAMETYPKHDLVTVKGELRDGPTYKCSANALATRPKIKQLNKKVENTLFRMAEPLRYMSGIDEEAFFDLAEQYLLLSHPHDSINGVTQDKTVEDTMNNLRQALEISEVLCDRACQTIVKKIDMSAFGDKDVFITLFNTLAFGRNETVRLFIDFPQTESVWDFDVVDAKGNVLDKQIVERKEVKLPVSSLHSRPFPFFVDRIECVVDVKDIPAMGYKLLKLVPKQKFNRKALFWADIRTSEGREIARGADTLENDFLRVTVNPNGTVDVLRKEDGRRFSRLNYFEDTGDAGDYWIYYPPYKNKTYNTLGAAADIWVEENGPVSATIGVKLNLTLPKDGDLEKRSAETDTLPITVYYTLSKDSRQVDVRTVIDNTVKDHRLRILFDCGVNTDEVESAGHFGKDTRPVAKDGKFWPEMQTLPMGYFVKRDDLGVVHNAFCEYEGINNAEGTLAVTVMRCVKNIICTEFRSAGKFLHEDGGQSLGRHEYEYALTFGDACPFMTAERFNAPIKAVQIGKGEGTELPLEKSFLEVTGGVVTSAVKKAEDSDATVVRVFNPSDEEKTINLRGTEVNLNEEEIGAFDGKVGAWKIVSVKI